MGVLLTLPVQTVAQSFMPVLSLLSSTLVGAVGLTTAGLEQPSADERNRKRKSFAESNIISMRNNLQWSKGAETLTVSLVRGKVLKFYEICNIVFIILNLNVTHLQV